MFCSKQFRKRIVECNHHRWQFYSNSTVFSIHSIESCVDTVFERNENEGDEPNNKKNNNEEIKNKTEQISL